jgi:hypothetical protein
MLLQLLVCACELCNMCVLLLVCVGLCRDLCILLLVGVGLCRDLCILLLDSSVELSYRSNMLTNVSLGLHKL